MLVVQLFQVEKRNVLYVALQALIGKMIRSG